MAATTASAEAGQRAGQAGLRCARAARPLRSSSHQAASTSDSGGRKVGSTSPSRGSELPEQRPARRPRPMRAGSTAPTPSGRAGATGRGTVGGGAGPAGSARRAAARTFGECSTGRGRPRSCVETPVPSASPGAAWRDLVAQQRPDLVPVVARTRGSERRSSVAVAVGRASTSTTCLIRPGPGRHAPRPAGRGRRPRRCRG